MHHHRNRLQVFVGDGAGGGVVGPGSAEGVPAVPVDVAVGAGAEEPGSPVAVGDGVCGLSEPSGSVALGDSDTDGDADAVADAGRADPAVPAPPSPPDGPVVSPAVAEPSADSFPAVAVLGVDPGASTPSSARLSPPA
ncbi:hypothetical protein ACFSL4_07000, partial [Streptomyces caeni]